MKAEKSKCIGCKMIYTDEEKIPVQRKNEPYITDMCCPKCKNRTFLVIQKKEQYTKKTAKELVKGDYFKKHGQRAWRKVHMVKELGDQSPSHHVGKLLVILHDCRQIIFDKEDPIEVADYPEAINGTPDVAYFSPSNN